MRFAPRYFSSTMNSPLSLNYLIKEHSVKKKSLGMHFFLTIFFGPLGLLYSRPGIVIPFFIGSFLLIAAAAFAEVGGGFGVLILVAMYAAPLFIGYIAVEEYNLSIDKGIRHKQEVDERRHQELVAAASSTNTQKSASETKACPFCAETILLAAVKCKHCGSTLI